MGTDTEILIEEAILLSQFMGMEQRMMTKINNEEQLCWYGYPVDRFICPVGAEFFMKFNTSWDWLFPVIDKINGMGKGYHFAIFKTYASCSVEKGGKFYTDFSFAHAEYITTTQTSLEAVYNLLVRFVKWHNENTSK